MNATKLIIFGVANIPIYFLVGYVFFKNWTEFWESIRFWLTPDILSAFRGEYWDDCWGEMKLVLWFGCCIACVVAEMHIFDKLFG